MRFFKQSVPAIKPVQTARSQNDPLAAFRSRPSLSLGELRLYDSLREAVPIIDAAIQKIIRLTGEFTVSAGNPEADRFLRRFCENVRVGAGGIGLDSFLSTYLDQLLTYGNAIGEIVPTRSGREIAALYNASLEEVEIRPGKTPLHSAFVLRETGAEARPMPRPELLFHTALNPRPGEVVGVSLLRGLPFVSSTLLKIYRSVGQNFDRMGNLRYAVTYKPSENGLDRATARERAMTIAREWADTMASSAEGTVRDFVAVGDVDIRVIGADNQVIDSEVPVRQLLEQIVAKLSLPPFLLGLSWSTTERMSTQQADILTSELEYYRRLLTPIIRKICRVALRVNGYTEEPKVKWESINLQDEVELARARLYNAQAQALEGRE